MAGHSRQRALAGLILSAVACGGEAQPATAERRPPCRGGAGGGFVLSDRASVAYAVSFASDTLGRDSLVLDAVFVARGRPGWEGRGGTRRRLAPPAMPESTGGLSGATVDTLWLRYDEATGVAWMHTQKVPLNDGANVILVDRVDGAGGPPTVVRTLRLPRAAALPPGACPGPGEHGGFEWTETLRATLVGSADVRAFAGL